MPLNTPNPIKQAVRNLDNAQALILNQEKELKELRMKVAKIPAKDVMIENLKLAVKSNHDEIDNLKYNVDYLTNCITEKDATIKRLNSRPNPEKEAINKFLQNQGEQ
jgi:hypothetical protein